MTVDLSGARASGAGDEFHELWAIRQALQMLDANSNISALTVEGVLAHDAAGSPEAVWDGVDCCIYRHGDANEAGGTVEIQQLKYSPTAPAKAWTVARLTSAPGGDRAKTLLYKLAKAYVGFTGKQAGPRVARIALVSNQPVADKALATIRSAITESIPTMPGRGKPPQNATDAQRLLWASGLDLATFRKFLAVLEFDCGEHSRVSIDGEILAEVGRWTDAEILETTSKLKTFIRHCMLPEGLRTEITRELILLQFGTSDPAGLFPCVSKIKEVPDAVARSKAKDVVDQLRLNQFLCLQGGAGTGKTTVLQQVRSQLPLGSIMVTFDCYGGGSYLDPSSYRHREEDAYRQIANEVAMALRLPLMLAPSRGRDQAQRFRARIEAAAQALAVIAPSAMLVVAIDAADNSITAAHTHAPPERSFVEDLIRFDKLPSNVRIVLTARPGRVHELGLPLKFANETLEGFTRDETGEYVRRFIAQPDDWLDDFHKLTLGNPRMQSYALAAVAAGEGSHAVLESLRPGGRVLDDLFRDQFDEAIRKSGIQANIELVCAGLIALPRPIPIQALAQALGLNHAQVSEICMDLALSSGLRIDAEHVGFADEDFEHFVREKASGKLTAVTPRVADYLLSRHAGDEYAAMNVASALYAAGRRQDLLQFVISAPESDAMKRLDPVRRREVETHRLQLAIRVCREAGNPSDAVRYVVLGSEGVRTEKAIQKLLVENPDLSVRFAAATASRLILMDGAQIQKHGAILAHAMEAHARNGDFISSRDAERRLMAWFRNREKVLDTDERATHDYGWNLRPVDLSPAIYAKLLEKGAAEAYAALGRVRPAQFRLKVSLDLIARLIADSQIALLKELADALPPRWRAVALVPIAVAGAEVDLLSLRRSLKYLSTRGITSGKGTRLLGPGDIMEQLLDIYITGCELLAADDANAKEVLALLAPFVSEEARYKDRLRSSDSAQIDAIFRAHALCSCIDPDRIPAGKVFLDPPKEEAKRGRGQDRQHLEQLQEMFQRVYAARARVLVGVDSHEADSLGDAIRRLGSDQWRFNNDYEMASLRKRVINSWTVLLARNVAPVKVLEHLSSLHQRWMLDQSDEGSRSYLRLVRYEEIHGDLASALAIAARECESERIGSEEKSSNLAFLSRLLRYVSEADSRAVFFRSIEVAEELDTEIFDLLMLSERMVSRMGELVPGPNIAADLTEVIRDAIIRFRNDREAIPLDQAMRALAQVSFPSAMAAATRWHDDGIENLESLIEPVIGVGIKQRLLSVGSALALVGLLRSPDEDTVESVLGLATAVGGGRDLLSATEELARDVCLDRMEASAAVKVSGDQKSAPWSGELRRRREMQERIRAMDAATSSREQYSAPAKVAISRHWSLLELTSGSALGNAIDEERAKHRANREWVQFEEILEHGASQVPPGQREAHLEALLSLDNRFGSSEVVAGLCAAVSEWQPMSPSVDSWCKRRIADVISERLTGFLSYRRWEKPAELERLCLAASLSNSDKAQALLQGVEKHAMHLTSSGLLQVAGWVIGCCEPNDVAEVSSWFLSRLSGRIPAGDRELAVLPPRATPSPQVVAASVFRLLGDVDHRYRWRAAHAVRRLGRFGEASVIDLLVDYLSSDDVPGYRSGEAPFYWLAARLWLTVALTRMTTESPPLVAKHAAKLFSVATDEDLPHVLLRGFARDACAALVEQGLWLPDQDVIATFARINESSLPPVDGDRYRGRGPSVSTRERFSFDTMDTTRYWYESIVDMFDGLTMTEFLDVAEGFIVDSWQAVSPRKWDERPRKQRFESSAYSLHSNGHGSIPLIEPYHTHLEWHAMWCALGALLTTHPLLKSEDDDYSSLTARIRRDQLTEPPTWLADLVTPKPLEISKWAAPSPSVEKWLQSENEAAYLLAVLPQEDDFIVVNSSSDTRSSYFSESVHITSALVSPQASASLLRALQTVHDARDYYLPTEGHDQEIRDGVFQLTGWLRDRHTEGRIDDNDPFNLGISSVSVEPGTAVLEALDLVVRDAAPRVWTKRGTAAPVLAYEAWGRAIRRDGREEYLGSEVVSSGHALKITRDELHQFLELQDKELILEVRIERRDERAKRTYNEEEDEKASATFDRVFLFRRDGHIYTTDGRAAAWKSFGS